MDEYAEVVKFTSGNSALNDQQLTQLRDQVWNTYVNNKLIEHEAEELGLTVTDAEIQSIISEGNSPILMQTPFRNEQTGRFDANVPVSYTHLTLTTNRGTGCDVWASILAQVSTIINGVRKR